MLGQNHSSIKERLVRKQKLGEVEKYR